MWVYLRGGGSYLRRLVLIVIYSYKCGGGAGNEILSYCIRLPSWLPQFFFFFKKKAI